MSYTAHEKARRDLERAEALMARACTRWVKARKRWLAVQAKLRENAGARAADAALEAARVALARAVTP